jgi:hypothetical protein
MVELLAAAVALRKRTPKEPLTAWYGSRRTTVPVNELETFATLAGRQSTHNAGAGMLRRLVLERMIEDVHEPGFGGHDDLLHELNQSPDLERFCERHWPVLTPEQMLNDLFGSQALLTAACEAAGLDDGAVELLSLPRTKERDLWRRRWFRSDVPLLDELLWLLGEPIEATELESDMEHEFGDEADVFTLDEERGDDPDLDGEEDEEELDPEPGEPEVESYDSWREGDEEDQWA